MPATDMGAISNVRQLLERQEGGRRVIYQGDTRRITAQHLADIHDTSTAILHTKTPTTHHNFTEALNDARSQDVPEHLIHEAIRNAARHFFSEQQPTTEQRANNA
jgi:hypothetical protein